MATLDFEKPILDLEHKIDDLRQMGSKRVTLEPEIKRLEAKLEKLKNDVYKNMTPWQRVQIARHPKRPYTLDYIRMMTDEFLELHGDRLYADDAAMIGGFAVIDGHKVMIVGHQKGRDVKENVMRNFGCAHPEGYRKAIRLMRLAAKFRVPVVCLIDTPGAYPGIGAEERGQAQAIAENLRDMMGLATTVIAVIIGEGGSGGALGIGVADHVLILQHAYYSVISPEGCASILWRSSLKAPLAAEALKLHGEDLIKFNIVDEIIPEPLGGAHRDPQGAADSLKAALLKLIKKSSSASPQELLDARYQKYRRIGEFIEK
ncbi:MAG: acetyl-CoA carboxylase carboxyltransferase subunit alpha [Candidatus Omnitrophica bacterium]|nr:acetyl-CoA carboxylase carboxyltransferase subunit alpha [Candidatus Omnitrophota bacterium]MDE2009435.1 acetyl-CoA carboxylase carboxyltransferase subunit alpha [Candidatus Omnitrophota bacterium]MDE2214646.1 acetyl-CoA carboxylase carboxyltransferase subunit alpha [Candidatus Omnitrophota bacterium]MDE2231811.1 acetyl-CoA carboxylase carboxyltransferase subunit alpha [Candidatus Omnitrophota bacterium]